MFPRLFGWSGLHQRQKIPLPLNLHPSHAALPVLFPTILIVVNHSFLYELTHLLESHYADQLYRYHNRPDARQTDLWSETDPPF